MDVDQNLVRSRAWLGRFANGQRLDPIKRFAKNCSQTPLPKLW